MFFLLSRDVVLAISGPPPHLYIRRRDFYALREWWSRKCIETKEKKACCSVVVYCGLLARQDISGQLVDLVFWLGFD